jgi:transposase InsO family protein
MLAVRDEENRILRARWDTVPPQHRPHYPPPERLAILSLRAATGWTTAETARRFLVTPNTISEWICRLDEQGPNALVQLREPVNRYPDFVTVLVQQLHKTVPALGKLRIAHSLAQAGLHLSKTTVARMLKRPEPKTVPPKTTQAVKGTKAAGHAKLELAPEPPRERKVTAKYPHHLWHVDLSLLPTIPGFSAPWFPFSLPQSWPFCFWIAVVLDHFSRSVVAWRLFRIEPTAAAVCRLLSDARIAAGQAPTYIVTDQGVQFRDEYRAWCDDNDVQPRFGAVGKSGSIAIVERFFRSLKSEMLRRLILVPLGISAMQREVTAYTFWYNQHCPHSALGGRTPAEVRHAVLAARDRPPLEPRARFPLARGQPVPLARRVRGKLELVVDRVDGRPHLPIVSLHEAA